MSDVSPLCEILGLSFDSTLLSSVGNLSENVLTCNLSRNVWSQSSQLAGPLWTDPGLKSGISVHELIFT